jgi:hypothetical protein
VPHVPDSRTDLPPGRYGSPRKFPVWLLVPLVVAGIAAAAFVVVSGARQITPDTRGTLNGFTIDSDTQVTATVDVRKPKDASATCSLRARNFYSDAVGTAEIVVGGATGHTTVTRSFPTSEKAVVVEVTRCTKSTDD